MATNQLGHLAFNLAIDDGYEKFIKQGGKDG